MCMTKQEMENKIAEIRSLKALKEETENELKAMEIEVITFLQEMEECSAEDKKGNPIRQYIGNDFKATYAPQSRITVDKDKVEELLSAEDFEKVKKESCFKVLRIN